MIPTTLPHLILYNLCILLGLLGCIWLVQVLRLRRRARKVLKYRLVCVICGMAFDDFTSEPLVKCPICGRLNERDRVLDL